MSWTPVYSIGPRKRSLVVGGVYDGRQSSDGEYTAPQAEFPGYFKTTDLDVEKEAAGKVQTTTTNLGQEVRDFTTVGGVDRPFFHVDLVDAVDAAVSSARNKDRMGPRKDSWVESDNA